MILLKIALRVVIIYLVLSISMRLMGKRQLGELEVSELITTFMLSEIATAPITSPEKSMLQAVVAILVLLALELVASFILLKIPAIKNLVSPKPNMLIDRGVINQKELSKQRLTNEELLSSLRQQGYTDLSEIYYAIMEGNGKLTVVPRSSSRPATTSELGLTVAETGMQHILVSDGRLDKNGMKRLGWTKSDVDNILSAQKCELSDIFLLTCDDSGNKIIIKKEKGQK